MRYKADIKSWSRRYAERIWGDCFILVWRILGNCRRISQRNLRANFDTKIFGLVFPGFQATQKIHAQNSRPELSAFLSNFTFLNPKFIHGDFLLTGETNKSKLISRPLCLKQLLGIANSGRLSVEKKENSVLNSGPARVH